MKFSRLSFKDILRFLRPFLLVALLAPVLFAVYQQWLGVSSALAGADWLQIFFGVVIIILAQPLMGWISWCVLNSLGQKHSFFQISAAYFISQAAKYLPGGIWAFPGRVVAYQALGVEKSASFVSLVQEVSLLFFGSAGIGLLGLGLGLPVASWLQVSAIAGIGACLVAVLVFQMPFTWKVLHRFKLISADTLANFTLQRAVQDWRWQVLAGLGSVLFWILVGWGFQYLVKGFAAQNPLTIIQTASLFGLAWSAGFVVVFAPSGLGVREAAITALLAPVVGTDAALSIALVARLWWMIGEFGYVAVSLAWSARQSAHGLVSRAR